MRVWQRLHRNGGLAFVREHPLDLFAATAFPNYGAGYTGSLDLNITEDFEGAKTFADRAAHPDCQNADECAGGWREGEIRGFPRGAVDLAPFAGPPIIIYRGTFEVPFEALSPTDSVTLVINLEDEILSGVLTASELAKLRGATSFNELAAGVKRDFEGKGWYAGGRRRSEGGGLRYGAGVPPMSTPASGRWPEFHTRINM